ncbi:MAG: YciI family protein [Melioribacteraceae bacterium]|nr:YciI family protein [Melioribacteraceae bacterium]MCF8263018.1 YciI family protein [Melioribacteraceae bacterium]MCF8413206.1 YciI family protein [Melioribacteraceae bacterium]MCF8430463.1 YciI family protein [Melioribacteraceae bacterium]
MKHFVVEIIYKASIDKIQETRPEHREHLQTGYKNGMLLMSGPQTPQIGGILIARANSMEEVADFCSKDPYTQKGLAHYQYIEFTPVSFSKDVKDWIEGK